MGAQFWWFYDVIVAVAILVCMFITVKRGIMKAAVSFVGYAVALALAFSLSSSITGSLYTRTVRDSNIKKIDQSISESDYIENLAKYIENLGYNVILDRGQLCKICYSGEDVDEKLYSYVNNINARKVDEDTVFYNKMRDGYATITSNLITKYLNEYSAEFAAEKIRTNPAGIYKFMSLLEDPDNQKPAAEYLVDNYLEEPYKAQIKLIVLIVALLFFVIMTIFIETAAGRNNYMEPSLISHTISALIGLFKGCVIVVIIAVVIRLYVVMGSNKMLFFNHDAIDKTWVFKYVYNFIRDI